MRIWGPGLYQDHEAADLKQLLSVLLGLPIDLDEVVRLANGDGVVFWLVLADQLERKGLRYAPAAGEAIQILRKGADMIVCAHWA